MQPKTIEAVTRPLGPRNRILLRTEISGYRGMLFQARGCLPYGSFPFSKMSLFGQLLFSATARNSLRQRRVERVCSFPMIHGKFKSTQDTGTNPLVLSGLFIGREKQVFYLWREGCTRDRVSEVSPCKAEGSVCVCVSEIFLISVRLTYQTHH